MSSSLLTSLDMSLDDLIIKKKASAGPIRRKNVSKDTSSKASTGRRQRRGNAAPYATKQESMSMDSDDEDRRSGNNSRRRKQNRNGGSDKATSILDRVGGSVGTSIVVKNLKFDIMEDEVRELFATVAKVVSATLSYDRSGRSTGVATVVYARSQDADKAIRQYHGRTLDGRTMDIARDGEQGAASSSSSHGRDGASRNKKEAMFGTALAQHEATRRPNSRGPKTNTSSRGSGGNGGRREKKVVKTPEELDAEMDTYMQK